MHVIVNNIKTLSSQPFIHSSSVVTVTEKRMKVSPELPLPPDSLSLYFLCHYHHNPTQCSNWNRRNREEKKREKRTRKEKITRADASSAPLVCLLVGLNILAHTQNKEPAESVEFIATTTTTKRVLWTSSVRWIFVCFFIIFLFLSLCTFFNSLFCCCDWVYKKEIENEWKNYRQCSPKRNS